MAMLVDIPMARHWYQQRAFIREHVFEEHRPTFAHVGGWWAKHTGLRRYDVFERDYFELPPFDDYRFEAPFRNVFALRELVVGPRAELAAAAGGEGARVQFDWGISLLGVRQPAPWTPGAPGYLEVPFAIDAPREPNTDVVVTAYIASGDRVLASWELPMGYGILSMDAWAVDEAFRGRHALPLPEDLPPGTYDLGIWLRGPRGYVVPANAVAGLPADAVVEPVRMADGEVRFRDRIEVVPATTLSSQIDALTAQIATAAAAGRCDEAEAGFIRLKRHRPVDRAWHASVRPPAVRAIADCHADSAAGRDPIAAASSLAIAHRFDHHSPRLAAVGAPVAADLIAQGQHARRNGDWETAYRRFAAVLRFQPWRAWVRRWAEEARDHRLGLTDDVRIGIGGEDDLREWEAKGTP